MFISGLPLVTAYTAAVRNLLQKAKYPTQHAAIEPPLSSVESERGLETIVKIRGSQVLKNHQAHYAAIETAFRDLFYELLVSTSIHDPSFSRVWGLLDFLLILSDKEQCEPALIFWLVEELLDSQTIEGCRKIFDYLESRRERMTAKHFKAKQLVILRACNELLRRLSRAEDTVFCGRVFIFLFQSFPLGDKSSVNLRGEYHVDNVTAFDALPNITASDSTAMEVDVDEEKSGKQRNEEQIPSSHPDTIQTKPSGEVSTHVKDTKDNATVSEAQKFSLDMDALYPVFWSLQEHFSMPVRLFDPSNLKIFRTGLEATLGVFKHIYLNIEVRGHSKALDDNKRGTKRKRGAPGEELSISFNPKYLTSRDLFELEISDLAFRRHILVQALILIDFLLSLTPKAKSKMENLTNRSVLYAYTLGEEDAKWASNMKTEIATYLQQGAEGKFYYRMVDTVLSRDKNWVRWKAENCPPIQRASVSSEDFISAKNGAQKACTNKRVRTTPMGALDLTFLSDGENLAGLEQLKDAERYSVPAPESFRGPIVDDEFEIAMAKTEVDGNLASDARASKMWRTLRIASKSKLNIFDRIEDGNNLQALFGHSSEGNDNENENENKKANDSDGGEVEVPGVVENPKLQMELDINLAKETVVK